MSFLQYKTVGYIGIITINRPAALNALNTQVLTELSAVLRDVDQTAIRCLVITGAGDKAFVAGADIAEMCYFTPAEGRTFSDNGNAVFLELDKFPLPTIAVVNGFALGGGLELAMSCDIILCSDKAKFGQPEVGLGITPGFGATQRLARLIGPARAKELIYTAAPINSLEAFNIGLVNHVYAPENLEEQAFKLANKIAVNAPIAVRHSKKAINCGLSTSIEEGIKIEAVLFGRCFASKDQKIGMQGFLSKEKEIKYTNQ